MSDVTLVNGPVAPGAHPLFQVTLPNGAVMTRTPPSTDTLQVVQQHPLVAENGEVLAAP